MLERGKERHSRGPVIRTGEENTWLSENPLADLPHHQFEDPELDPGSKERRSQGRSE